METDDDGKSTRRNYYSINYRMFVNVVKYKIDHVRRKLETEERDLTSRASFICQACKKTYTDLEVSQIFDMEKAQFRCSYCDGIVEEDPNVRPTADSRLVIARFNDQMKPIYELLKETENIKWSINEADRNNLMTGAASAGATNNNNNHLAQNNLAANLTNGTSSSDQQNLGQLNNLYQQDQYPVTIIGLDEKDKQDQQAKNRATIINPEVEALLLREESLANSNSSHGGASQEGSRDEESGIITTDDDSVLMVNVGNTKVPIDKISEEHVELMTKPQRDEYVRIMQRIHNLVFG